MTDTNALFKEYINNMPDTLLSKEEIEKYINKYWEPDIQYLIKTEKSFLNVISYEKYSELIAKCIDEVKDELLVKPPIILYGKTVHQQRDIGFFSDNSIGYYYSKQLAKSKPLTPHLNTLMNIVNSEFYTEYNGILVNRYEGGNNYICDHSDDEKNLDKGGVIAISYGEVRKFRIRDKNTKKIVMDIPTTSNSIIHMGGDFQKEFTHGIPIEKKIQGIRYSFTFRKHTL
jgi:alkylated DNA repair dioxygenase AlkB